jgi:hypothetical protein
MIVTNGKIRIKRYLAGYTPVLARSIAFGIGGTAENVNDTKLQFEVGRSDIALIAYDFVNDELIFKADVDAAIGGKIYEAALYSASTNDAAGRFGSRLLTTFDEDLEGWVDATSGVDATYSPTNTRIGTASLNHNPAASGTKTDALSQIFLDFSGNSGADKFVFAFNVNNAFVSSMRFRFLTDASNYYEFALGPQTTGYKIVEATKSSATVTGTPSWDNITEMRVSTTSTSGGAASVDFDGIRIDDEDTLNQDYVMISREVLASPFTKQEGSSQEIEFSLDVNV